jgi:hypothetical protein
MQSFASAPQAVGSRQKYRDPEDTLGAKNNIMHDRRVVRGNTYASVVEPQKAPDAAAITRQREAQKRRLMRANQTRKRAGTPEAVPGRKHMDIQTDSYLEELTERTVEFEAETQTDFLLDRPPSPLFMPAKIGIDVETQIEEGDLFDFDVECEPILEVLVGKTLEQGMMEVLEEAELDSLRRHQEDFEKRRNAELLEVQRMEAAEKRRHDEMERRMQQQTAQRERDLSTMRKVVSRSIAAAHFASIKDRALAHLMDAGTFQIASQKCVESQILPNLLQQASTVLAGYVENQNATDLVTKNMVSKRLTGHENKLEVERQRLRVIDEAERKGREEKKQELKALADEKQRLMEEQAKMEEWENTQPPPPAELEEVVLNMAKTIGDDDALQEGTVFFGDDSTAKVVDAEQLAKLHELIDKFKEDSDALLGDENKILASLQPAVPATEENPEVPATLTDIRIGVPKPVEPAVPADDAAAEPASP